MTCKICGEVVAAKHPKWPPNRLILAANILCRKHHHNFEHWKPSHMGEEEALVGWVAMKIKGAVREIDAGRPYCLCAALSLDGERCANIGKVPVGGVVFCHSHAKKVADGGDVDIFGKHKVDPVMDAARAILGL